MNAVDVPVTLKIRTGWDKANRNCVQIGKIAEQSGIQALTIHGRTKECLFEGGNGIRQYSSSQTINFNSSYCEW